MSKYPVPPKNPIEGGTAPDPENVKTWEWFIFWPVIAFAGFVAGKIIERLLN